MMNLKYFHLTILLVIFFEVSKCQILPTWLTNYDVQADKILLIDGNSCGCITNPTDNPMATVTFVNAFSQTPNFAYGISTIKGASNMKVLKFEITKTSLNQTGFHFFIKLVGPTKMWDMEIRYIAISKLLPHHINSFVNVPVNFANGALINITIPISGGYTIYENTINYTAQANSIGSSYGYFNSTFTNNKILIFLTTIYLSANNLMDRLDLTISSTILSTQLYKISVNIGKNSAISRLEFSMIVYDEIAMNIAALNYCFVQSRIEFTGTGGFYPFQAQFLPNFMVGITDFSNMNDASYIEFKLDFANITNVHKLVMYASNPYMGNPPMTRFNFTTLYMKTWICRNNTVLDPITDLCVYCPLPNCLSCFNYYSCLICNNTNGYFLDHYTNLCQLCTIPYCLICQNLTTCLLCDNNAGYFLDYLTGQCFFCNVTNCLVCLTLNKCSVCNQPKGFYVNYGTGKCQTCAVPNCLTCLTLTTCAICDLPNGFYINSLTGKCQSCPITGCLSCSNLTACSDCDQNSNYIKLPALTCSLCQSNLNLFANGTTQTCQLCILNQCLVCISLTKCSQCNITNNFFLNAASTCQYCDPLTNKFINPSTFNCQLCSFLNCQICSSFSVCKTCQIGYYLDPATNICEVCTTLACPEICGDFIRVGTEQCDDGNSQIIDGCSDCKIDPDFVCEPDLINSPRGSACYFMGQIRLDIKYIEKINGQNMIKVMFEYFPKGLAFWDSINFSSIVNISSPVPIKNIETIRNSNGTAILLFEYLEDIQGSSIKMKITPTDSNFRTLSRTKISSNSITIIPDDNESAQVYDKSVYQVANFVSIFCLIISVICLIFFVVGFISGKMIAIQMLAVVQFTFFSLMSFTQLNPSFAALNSLNLVTGYNSLGNYYLEDKISPIQARGTYLLSRFADNFNIFTIFIILPILISLISFIVWKKCLKNSSRTETIFKKSLGQYTLYGILFSGYLIGVTFTLQTVYGIKNTSDLIGNLSLSLSIIFFLIMIAYFVFVIAKPEYFDQFTRAFNNDKLSTKYYSFMLFQRFVLGMFLVLMIPAKTIVVLPMIIFVILGVFVLIYRPYKENYNNYRVIANMTISTIIQIIFLSYRVSNLQDKNRQSAYINLPIFISILLLICVLYNSAAIIYKIYKKITNKNSKQLQQDQIQQISKIQKQSMMLNTQLPSKRNYSMQSQRRREGFNLVQNVQTQNQINHKEIKRQIKQKSLKNQEVLRTPQFMFNDSNLPYAQASEDYRGV